MSKPSKFIAVLVLVTSTWLTGYQIGDAAEDDVEDMSVVTQLARARQLAWTNQPGADNETDDNIPNISDQSLIPASNGWLPNLIHRGSSAVLFAAQLFVHIDVAAHILSPPRFFVASDEALALRHLQFAAPTRILAPPLA